MWMGVGCPFPPVRNNIVTPRHLFVLKPLNKVAKASISVQSMVSVIIQVFVANKRTDSETESPMSERIGKCKIIQEIWSIDDILMFFFVHRFLLLYSLAVILFIFSTKVMYILK